MPLEEGTALEPVRIASVNPERMKTMAALLQDSNRIHIKAEAVRALGMGDRVVNQGPTNMAYLMRMLTQAAPDARIERMNVRFLANVLGGDAVVATGQITAEGEPRDGRRRLECQVALDVEGGARALEGSATISIPNEMEGAKP